MASTERQRGIRAPFVNRQKEVFEAPIDVAYLRQVQAYVVELISGVVSSVTHMGWQFPGGTGPGKPLVQRP